MSYPEKQAVEAWRKAKESAYQQCAQVNKYLDIYVYNKLTEGFKIEEFIHKLKRKLSFHFLLVYQNKLDLDFRRQMQNFQMNDLGRELKC